MITTLDVTEDDDGNCILTFPPELMEQLGWSENQLIKWEEIDGAFVLSKVDEDGNENH
jgi:hypothetical protein